MIGRGVRRVELEHYLSLGDLPAMGIVSATQQDWLITFVTTFLSNYRRNSCAVLYMPNRAQDMRKEVEVSKEMKQELDEDDPEAQRGPKEL